MPGLKPTEIFGSDEFLECKRNIALRERRVSDFKKCVVLGKFKNYSFDHDYLYVKENEGYVKLPKDLTGKSVVIEFDRDIPAEAIFHSFFEPTLRRHLLEEECSLTHASCVSDKNKGYTFVSWMHTGKTNIMLHMVSKGFKYLSDDATIISKSGFVYPYPKRINLFSYNSKTHPELKNYLIVNNFLKKKQFEVKTWFLDRMRNFIKNRTFSSSSKLNFIIQELYEYFDSSLNFFVNPKSIGIDVEKKKKEISSIFILLKEKGRKKLKIEEVKGLTSECKQIAAVNGYEDLLKKQYRMYVNLFAFPNENYKEEMHKEIQILEGATKNSRIFRAYLPEEGATEEINKEIASFIMDLS